MPKAQDAASWTNPPLKKAPPGKSPPVSTLVSRRDGSRPTGPLPPEFTLSATSGSITAIITESNGADSYEIRVGTDSAIPGLTVTGLEPEQTYPVQVRGIDEDGPGDWSDPVNKTTSAASDYPEPPEGDVLFAPDFDSMPDWIPNPARVTYPSEYDPNPVVEPFDSVYSTSKVSSSDAPDHKDYGGEITDLAGAPGRPNGKALLTWDEAEGNGNQWGTECLLGRDLDQMYTELYAEAWFKFQPGFRMRDAESDSGSLQREYKILRVKRHAPENIDKTRFHFSGTSNRHNGLFTLIKIKSWTQQGGSWNRARIPAFRRGYTDVDKIGTSEENYFMSPQSGQHGEVNIYQGGSDPLRFEEVFNTGDWFKIGLYVKLNSAPGVKDGIEEVYVNDILERGEYGVPWVEEGQGEGVDIGWNWVGLGGNGHNFTDSDNEDFEQWWAATDLRVYHGKPEGLGGQ